MDSARDKKTKQIVYIDQLQHSDKIDTKNYMCWGCGIDVYPSSWRKENKKRPSFNRMPGTEHKPGCDADAENKYIAQGQKKSIRNILDAVPELMPNGLKLIDERPIVSSEIRAQGIRSSSTRSTSSTINDKDDEQKKSSRRQVNTIRQICRAFISYPYDRNMSLDISGINADTYMTVFKKLKTPIQYYQENHVFYSQLLWNKINFDQKQIIIPLSGEWKKNENGVRKPSRFYKLYVEWDKWSKAKKTIFRKELENAQKDSQEALNAGNKERAQVFFIGKQDIKNPEIFYASDFRLICVIMGYITYPEYN